MTDKQFHTRGSIDLDESIDLEECHQTPIHNTALIQPHGALIEADRQSLVVQSHSVNLPDFLPSSPEDVFGRDISAIFGSEEVGQISQRLHEKNIRRDRILLDSYEEKLYLSMFPMGETVGLELEPSLHDNYARETENILTVCNDLSQRAPQTKSLEHLYEKAINAIRGITDYDRVMLYQFDEDGHGTVEAETKQPELHSYLGQQFPSSDIPEPARRLYTKNRIRYIPRTDYEPIPIIGSDGKRKRGDLDLTYSSLRNVPLVHRKYLKNMEVGASLSISLLVDGELRGLIACHAREPTPLSWPVRNGCKLIGQSISQHIARLEKEKKERGLRRVKQFRTEFTHTSTSFDDLFDQLKRDKRKLLSLLDANGFLIQLEDRLLCLTEKSVTIPEKTIAEIIQGTLEDNETVKIESITDEIDPDWSNSSDLSGFLALRINQSADSFCAWFRPEYEQTIRWGGDPRQPVDVNEKGQLSPRSSFQEWTQVVEEQCRRWTDVNILIAREMLESFEQSLLAIQSHELRKAIQAKETLMGEVHHRVKNNFTLAASLIGLQKRRIEDSGTRKCLDEIYNRLHSMASLHKILYSGDDVQNINMEEYTTDILENIQENYQASEVEYSYVLDLDEVILTSGKAMYCGLVLTELVSDSIEHGIENTSDGTITVKLYESEDEIHLSVTDNGPGWPQDFDPFESDSFGLTVVKSLVEDQLKGSIRIDGREGATFEITFPKNP